MAKIKTIFIVCGEPSGDLLAGDLASAIGNLNPEIKIFGVGGAHLAKAGCEIFYNINALGIMGFFDVLKKLPKFLALKKLILDKITHEKPDALILVDFSGFNLRLAQSLNLQLPVIYYVSPQVWASREGRIKNIKKFISKMIVLFKFEEAFYQKRQIPATWVGHPAIDLVKPTDTRENFLNSFGINPAKKIIALLPGSRKQEVRLMLPLMLKAAQEINQIFPAAQFIIAKASNLDTQIYQNECKNFNLNLKVVDGRTYDCLNAAEASLVCSGTATLEAAIIGQPFIIVYKTNLLNYLLYRPQIKIPYIGMVNIVAGKKIVPEFIQFAALPKKISAEIIRLLNDQQLAGQMRSNLKVVKESLGQPGAADRAAKLILDYLKK